MADLQILLVDDQSNLIGSVVEQIFPNATVTIVEDSTKALAIFISMGEKLDVVFLDILMENLDGPHLCNSMREHAKICVPIIFITASSSLETQLKALRTSADTLWEKGKLMNESRRFRDTVHKLVRLYAVKREHLRLMGKAEEADQLADGCRNSINSAVVRLQHARATILAFGFAERIHKLTVTLRDLMDREQVQSKNKLILTYLEALGKEVSNSLGGVDDNLKDVESFLDQIRGQLIEESDRADHLKQETGLNIPLN